VIIIDSGELRMESAWSNGKPAYRCRHGHTTASAPDPERLKNAYVREDRILSHLPALHLLLTEPAGGQRRRRTRRGIDVRHQFTAEDVTGYLREQQIILTYDPGRGHPARRHCRGLPGHLPDSKLTEAPAAPVPEGESKKTAGRLALAEACSAVTSQHARKQADMGNYCVRKRGDLNPGTGEISLIMDLNSKTGEESPG
jgi:hypothetical protein